MKILYLTQLYPPLVYGGGEYIFAKWAEEFARRGHEVSVITQKVIGTEPFERLNGVSVYRVGPEFAYNGALYNIGIGRNLGFVTNLIRMTLKLVPDFEIVHSNTYMPSIAAEIVAHRHRRPHVMTIHDVFTRQNNEFRNKWEKRNELKPMVRLAGSFVERFVLSLGVEKVHTVSETSRMDLITAGIKAERITVIPNAIKTEEYGSQTTKVSHQIAYVGRLVFYKNLDTVIKAFREVCNRNPEARMIIGGKGPFEDELKALATELGLQSNVVFAGQISDAEKVNLISQSQLTVQPSIMEGFGISIIESFYCGTPVLASNVMPLPELVKNGVNGSVIDPFCVNAWTESLCDYLTNPGKCALQGQAGRRLVEESYTIDKVVNRLESLYVEMIGLYHHSD